MNSGGNAILRTADGNIISSGIGSGLAGYGYSSSGFMGTSIIVGSAGQVITSRSRLTMGSSTGVRAVAGGFSASGYSSIYVGSAGASGVSVTSQGSFTPIGVDKRGVSVRMIPTKYSSGGKSVVISTSRTSGGSSGGKVAGGGTSGTGEASGGTGGSGVDGSGSGVSGGTVVGGTVTGATVLGSASSLNANGELSTYGTGITMWTLQGATTEGSKQIEVIGDFGGE